MGTADPGRQFFQHIRFVSGENLSGIGIGLGLGKKRMCAQLPHPKSLSSK